MRFGAFSGATSRTIAKTVAPAIISIANAFSKNWKTFVSPGTKWLFFYMRPGAFLGHHACWKHSVQSLKGLALAIPWIVDVFPETGKHWFFPGQNGYFSTCVVGPFFFRFMILRRCTKRWGIA